MTGSVSDGVRKDVEATGTVRKLIEELSKMVGAAAVMTEVSDGVTDGGGPETMDGVTGECTRGVTVAYMGSGGVTREVTREVTGEVTCENAGGALKGVAYMGSGKVTIGVAYEVLGEVLGEVLNGIAYMGSSGVMDGVTDEVMGEVTSVTGSMSVGGR